jgi:hypothetical protein
MVKEMIASLCQLGQVLFLLLLLRLRRPKSIAGLSEHWSQNMLHA